MGLRRAIERLKRKMKRRRAWLLAGLLVIAAASMLWMANHREPVNEVIALPDGGGPEAIAQGEAYFSLNPDNRLTLYAGKPGYGKAARVYFQVDMEYLASSMPEARIAELVAGIPVSDDEEYSSVLSTFSDYALDE